jgi:hypothetical protein
MPTVNLLPNQTSTVTVNGADAGGNPAPVTDVAATIDNHTIAYAATSANDTRIPANAVVVVARGPVGTFSLTVNAKDANGNTLPPQTQAFAVVAGPAVVFSLSVGTPTTIGSGTPNMPAGW